MKAVILHGGTPDDAGLEAVHAQLAALLQAQGCTVETLRVASMTIQPCGGCFNCWLKTPGECVYDDDGRTVTRALAQADVTVFLTPVSFGGYAGLLKTAVDRIVPNVSPLFTTLRGEMHHRLRYPRPARFAAVGWQRTADAEAAAVFTQLHRRNALNLHSPAAASAVLHAGQPADEQQARLAALVRDLEVI